MSAPPDRLLRFRSDPDWRVELRRWLEDRERFIESHLPAVTRSEGGGGGGGDGVGDGGGHGGGNAMAIHQCGNDTPAG